MRTPAAVKLLLIGYDAEPVAVLTRTLEELEICARQLRVRASDGAR